MTGMDGINSLQKMLGALQVNETSNVGSTAAASAKAQGSTTTPAGGGSLDSASLSAAGMASQSADVSDVRMSKVTELRQAIGSGTYNVPASAVADKMVEGLLK